MTSAAVAASLFVLVLIDVFTTKQATGESVTSTGSPSWYAVVPVIAALMLIGDYAWFTSKASSDNTSVASNAAPRAVQPRF